MPHLEHTLKRRGSLIVCPGCDLRVERPAGVPSYARAVMRRW